MTFIKKYQTAIAEAQRFIEKANKVVQGHEDKVYADWGNDNASAIRASMDLSNALVDLRRSDWK